MPQSTRATHIPSSLAPSFNTASLTSVKDGTVTPVKRKRKSSPISVAQKLQTDDSGIPKAQDGHVELHWTDDGRNIHRVYVSNAIVARLRQKFTFPADDAYFLAFLTPYLKHKYKDAQTGDFPYPVPPSVYKLCREEVANVTHELSADAINCSGVCESFCSASAEGISFGAEGTWESVEDVVRGGAGHAPNETKFLRRLIATCERNILTAKPYCRIMLLQAKEDSEIDDVLYSDKFNGEIVATIPSHFVTEFRHQLEFFRDGCDALPDTDTLKLREKSRFASLCGLPKNI